jgi:acid phosphatase class B
MKRWQKLPLGRGRQHSQPGAVASLKWPHERELENHLRMVRMFDVETLQQMAKDLRKMHMRRGDRMENQWIHTRLCAIEKHLKG